MNENQLKDLRRGLQTLGLSDASEAGRMDVLLRYIKEIELWNPRYKLVAPGEDLVRRHVLDSLSALKVLGEMCPGTLADVGSGAGFPGIPLSIWMDRSEITLIEKMGRRAGFLRNVSIALGLRNVHVLEKPVEQVLASESGFDVVTFRAWSAIDEGVLDSMRNILAPAGRIAAYKGRRSVIETELKPIRERLTPPEIIPLPAFGADEERHLVVFGLV